MEAESGICTPITTTLEQTVATRALGLHYRDQVYFSSAMQSSIEMDECARCYLEWDEMKFLSSQTKNSYLADAAF